MATATAQMTNSSYTTTPGQFNQIPFQSINEPGCYICNWSGHLLRVPEDGVAPGRSPLVNIIGNEPLFVTKLSTDPYIPVTKARLLASNLDVWVNF
jgi:hypothetical protein